MSDIPGEMLSQDFKLFLGDVDKDLLLEEVVDSIIPEAYDTVPSNDHFSGIYNFDVLIPASKTLVYSQKLEKLFIKMSNDFTVLFNWNYSHTPISRLFVRAKPRFSYHEDARKPVKRCLQHAHEEDHSNRDAKGPIRHHILRCHNTQAIYDGGLDQHFSVCVPLIPPEIGTEFVLHTYQFVCQSSCSSGMNRRPIEVIFTLEDECGEIHGRKSINVRICSCPKRDKEKEEAEVERGQPPPSKRRKTTEKGLTPKIEIIAKEEHQDTNIHAITINMVGLRAKKALLESAFNIVAGQMALHPETEQFCRPVLEDIKNRINDC